MFKCMQVYVYTMHYMKIECLKYSHPLIISIADFMDSSKIYLYTHHKNNYGGILGLSF